jgi:lipoprotein-anchoring transpeptidase ErfK/SrfK
MRKIRSVLLRVLACLALALVAGAVVAPASRQSPAIARAVKVGTIPVGGLTSEPARTAVSTAFSQPVVVTYGDRSWTAGRARFHARAAVDDAVSEALTATRDSQVPVAVTSSRAAVRAFVTKISHAIARKPQEPTFVGFDGKPVIRPGRPGVAVRTKAAVAAVERALSVPGGKPVEIPTRSIPPAKTPGTFGPLVVIDRAANSLRLYDGTKLVRQLHVATGQAAYPTPAGMFHVVDMQRNPWWYPPNSDWARGEKPVPPGPGNPLGTRWMGIDSPGVGMHGTPDDASIGYSVSHGCIRMHIPDAEWLFEHVDVGTPVLIR